MFESGIPYEFWEARERNKNVFKYSFAPILEEAGILLLGAQHLWHPWSLRRKKELRVISQELRDKAETFRDRGLSWAGGVLEEAGNASYTLHVATCYRYHSTDTPEVSCPEASQYMASMALKLLFALLPEFQKLEKKSWNEKGLSDGLCKMIEDIIEAPYYNPSIEIPDDTTRAVVAHSIFVECDGLAYMQAKIEDAYVEENPRLKREKESGLSDDELRNLASDIGMRFETVKDVFETEHSSWWERSTEYRQRAEAQKEIVVSSILVSDEAKEGIQVAWDTGSPTIRGAPSFLSSKDVSNSEMVIKTFIAILSSFGEQEWSADTLIALNP